MEARLNVTQKSTVFNSDRLSSITGIFWTLLSGQFIKEGWNVYFWILLRGVGWYKFYPIETSFLKNGKFSLLFFIVINIHLLGQIYMKNILIAHRLHFWRRINNRMRKKELSEDLTKCAYNFGTYFSFRVDVDDLQFCRSWRGWQGIFFGIFFDAKRGEKFF